jgi:LysM repeat protein
MIRFMFAAGWRVMLVALILVTALGGATPSARAQNLPPNWAAINTGWLNIRSGPSTLYTYLGKAQFGANVVLLGRADNNWVQIQVPNSVTGWVNRAYLLTSVDYGSLPVTWSGAIATPPPDPAKFWAPVDYTVQPGDTLLSIAQRYNMSWHTLASINGIPNPGYIYVGQRLIIRSGGPGDWPAWAGGAVNGNSGSANTARYHTVQYGETLGLIAAAYGTTWSALAAANNLWNPNLIYAGQTLVIP